MPLRATPATSNSPESDTICDVIRRMKALSSTIRTRGRLEDTRSLAQRPDFHAPVVEKEIDASPVVRANVLGDDRDLRIGERLPHRGDIAFADVHASRGQQVREHARAAYNPGVNPFGPPTELPHLGEQRRHRS